MRILGLDPGSQFTGFGCVDRTGRSLRAVAHGVLSLGDGPHEGRILKLYEELSKIIKDLKPGSIVIEKVFFAKNPLSALKLGQIRGVLLLCAAQSGVECVEYSPNEVKQALSGHGHTTKDQMAKMVELFVGQQHFARSDASDAMSLALCHALSGGPRKSVRGPRSQSIASAVSHRIKSRL